MTQDDERQDLNPATGQTDPDTGDQDTGEEKKSTQEENAGKLRRQLQAQKAQYEKELAELKAQLGQQTQKPAPKQAEAGNSELEALKAEIASIKAQQAQRELDMTLDTALKEAGFKERYIKNIIRPLLVKELEQSGGYSEPLLKELIEEYKLDFADLIDTAPRNLGTNITGNSKGETQYQLIDGEDMSQYMNLTPEKQRELKNRLAKQ